MNENENRSQSPDRGEPGEPKQAGVTPTRHSSANAFRRLGDSSAAHRSLSGVVQFRNAATLGGLASSVQLNGTSSNAMQGVMSTQTDEVLKLKKQVRLKLTKRKIAN